MTCPRQAKQGTRQHKQGVILADIEQLKINYNRKAKQFNDLLNFNIC